MLTRRTGRRQALHRRLGARAYFRLRDIFLGMKVDPEYSMLSILSRKVVDSFLSLGDRDRQYMLLLHWMGFQRAVIEIEHAEREEGKSSYTMRTLLKVALDGLFFQTTVLLRWIVYAGFAIAACGLLLAAYLTYAYFVTDPLPGWTSVAVLTLVLGGVMIAATGVTGLYVGKIFDQVKGRPLFLVDTVWPPDPEPIPARARTSELCPRQGGLVEARRDFRHRRFCAHRCPLPQRGQPARGGGVHGARVVHRVRPAARHARGSLRGAANTHPPSDYSMFVAIGFSRVNQARAEMYHQCKEAGYDLVSYVNSRATQWGEFTIGDNTFIFEDNVIQPFVRIGSNVVLWSGNHIGHDAQIGDHVFIASHAVVSGNVLIGDYCFVGVNATFRDGVKVAPRCVIGAARPDHEGHRRRGRSRRARHRRARAQELGPEELLSGRWIRRGLVVEPPVHLAWASSHAMVPTVRVHGDERLELLFSPRDDEGRSRVARAWFADLGAAPEIEPEPVLDPGPLGAFDDSGVNPSCLVSDGDRWLLYYIGWTTRGDGALLHLDRLRRERRRRSHVRAAERGARGGPQHRQPLLRNLALGGRGGRALAYVVRLGRALGGRRRPRGAVLQHPPRRVL